MFNNFKHGLQDLFQNQENCDVTFSCVDPTSPTGFSTIMAHKFILSLVSDVFKTMFYGEAAKQENVKDEGKPISIDDIQMPRFKMFLSFIYTKFVDFKSIEIAAEFHYIAHKYNAIDALNFITKYMVKEMNPENVILLFETACLYENLELKDACIKIFSEKTMDVLDSTTFLMADPKVIEEIYKLNTLDIDSELQLVMALERYIAHNKAIDSDVAEKVHPVICQIRFLTLAAPIIAKTTLLNPEDSLAVIGCLSSESAILEMPSFLSSNKQKRAFTNSAMEMIRKLSQVYSDKYCIVCKSCTHCYWNCSSYGTSPQRAKLKIIYQKYNHVWLMDYAADDLKAVYDLYKAMGKV